MKVVAGRYADLRTMSVLMAAYIYLHVIEIHYYA